MTLTSGKKKSLAFGYINRGSRMKKVIVSHHQTVLSSDYKLEHVQKRERIDRTWNIYSGKDFGKKLFKHINGCHVEDELGLHLCGFPG